MKKILSVLLAVMMLLSAMPVMATEVVDDHKHEGCPGGKVSADGLHWACEKDAASEIIPATCTVAQHRDYYCQEGECDAVFTLYSTVETAKGHTPKLHASGDYAGQPEATVVTPATCEKAGVQKLFCTTCEEYYEEPIEALKHQWVDVEEEFFVGTCTEDAYKVRYCTNATCPLAGAHQKYDIVKAPGHNFDSRLIAFKEDVDCETDGIYEVYVACSHNSAWKDPNGEYYKWDCEAHSETAVASVELKKEVIAELHQKALENYIVPTDGEKEEAKTKKVPVEYVVAERIAAAMDSDKIVEVATDVVYPGTNYEDMQYTIDFDAKVNYVPATCTEKGYVELSCTTETGKCYVKFEIAALGHVYTINDEDVKHKDATCLKNGSVLVVCCNPFIKEECDFLEQIEIKAPGKHTFNHEDCHANILMAVEAVDACCKVTVAQEYEFNKEPVVATISAHDYEKNAWFEKNIVPCIDYTVQSHCCGYWYYGQLKNGEEFGFWIDCSAKDEAVTVPGDETKHEFDDEKFAHESATCTEDGWSVSYCKNCGKNVYEKHPAWNHVDPATGYSAYEIANYETDVVEATCTEDGSMKLTCKLCGDVQTKVLPATGHGWDKDNEGNQRHDYRVVVTKKMTCKEAGSETWYCDYCQGTQVHAIPIKHVEPKKGAVVTDSTCTIDGAKSYVCENCHDTINEVIPAKGHTFERAGYTGNVKYEGQKYDGYIEASCQWKGFYYRVCEDARCDKAHKDLVLKFGSSKVGYFTISTGKFFEKVEVGEKTAHFMVAQDMIVDGKPVENLDVNLIVTKLPTCCTAGEATYNCALCKTRATITMPALGHNETVTWNSKDRVYEITCQVKKLGSDKKAAANFRTYMVEEGRNYLYTEILSCIDTRIPKALRENFASQLQENVIEDLTDKMIQKKDVNGDGKLENIVRGVGCGIVVDEIKVNKTHYDATMKDNGDGTLSITIEVVDNCVKLEEPRLIVSWAYTLSDGTSMTVTGNYGAPYDEYWEYDAVNGYSNLANDIVFTVPAPEVDFTTELVQTTIAVTTGWSTDMGAAYANGYGWDVIEAK